MKLADALVTTLRDWDLRYVFGVSGANIEHVHDAIHRLGQGNLRSVMAKTEVGAAFMADGRARTHHTLGVCCATSGGGMMNLAVGIAESFADSVPVLAIVGQVPSSHEGRGGFQDSSGKGRTVDAQAVFRALAKHVARLEAEGFWESLYAAVKAALSGRHGPSVLLVTRDAFEQQVRPRPSWFPAHLSELASETSVDEGKVQKLYDALRSARRPVVLLGQGASRPHDADAVREFISLAQLPVATTMGSPAAFPQQDPLYLGSVGMAGHPSVHAYLNDQADFILAVGTGLDVLTRQPIEPALARCAVGAVTLDATELLRAVQPKILLEAEVGATFRRLIDTRRAAPFEHGAVRGYELSRYTPVLESSEPTFTRSSALRQSEALDVLQAYLPERGHVLYDAGNCAAAALHYLELPRDVTGTIALGMGGMGYAIAAAIGAQIGEMGRRRTLALVGDGAFLMHGLEVHTAAEQGLAILFVVFNNSRHGMCVTRQQLYFAGRVECSEYARVDVATIARGLSSPDRLWVGRASNRAELETQLLAYATRATPRTGVLELQIGLEEMPPFAPFVSSNAETYVMRSGNPAAAVARATPGVAPAIQAHR